MSECGKSRMTATSSDTCTSFSTTTGELHFTSKVPREHDSLDSFSRRVEVVPAKSTTVSHSSKTLLSQFRPHTHTHTALSKTLADTILHPANWGNHSTKIHNDAQTPALQPRTQMASAEGQFTLESAIWNFLLQCAYVWASYVYVKLLHVKSNKNNLFFAMKVK